MQHRPGALSAVFTAFCLCLAPCLGTSAAEKPAPAAAASHAEAEDPLTIDQIIALLEAKVGEKVIFRQIEATGTRLTMTVDTLLSLKGAGASDALLEALQEETGASEERRSAPAAGKIPPIEGVEREHPFRVFLMEDDSGGRVVHITNLDEDGRRIGGEIPEEHRATRNVVARGEHAAPPDEMRGAPRDGGYAEGGTQQPVIVNVYNNSPAPANDGTALIGGSEPIGGDAFINTGIYPGYFNYGYGYSPTVYPHGAVVGPRYGYGGVIYSPPGSYSHYVRYHRPYGSHQFKNVSMYPYQYGIPASTRNNVYFGRR